MTTSADSTRLKNFVTIGLVVIVCAVTATSYWLWRLRAETIDRQFEYAELRAQAFAEHLTQSFNVIDRTLLNLDVSDISRRPSELTGTLRHAPYLRSTGILDDNDTMLANSNPRNVGIKVNRSDFLPAGPGPLHVLRVGAAQAGRDFHDRASAGNTSGGSDLSFIPVARDIHGGGTDNTWHTVVASVNPDYFLNFYSNHLDAVTGAVQLLRYDGLLLLSTNANDIPGQTSRTTGLVARIAESELGRFEESPPDQPAMLTAYRASRGYPYVVVVRLDKSQALASWRTEAVNTLAIVGAVLAAALTLAGVYFVRYQRVAREQARDQERLRIAAIAFESQEGIIVTDARGQVLQVNAAFCAITGYPADEAIGRDMEFLKSDQHDPAFHEAIRRSLEQNGRYCGEIMNRHKDGSVHPHFQSITAVFAGDGQVSHYVSTLTDITERKHIEESLLTLSRAVEQSPVSIIITDAAGDIQYVNPVFVRSTGYSMSEVQGQNPRLLSSHEKSIDDYRSMWATLIAGDTWQGEFHNRRKDGSLFWEFASISPVYNDKGVLLHYVAVKEDITARKLADESIRELNRDFVAFLENTSDFIYFKDGNSRFRFCSQTLANITGHDHWRDMVGKHDREVFPADTARIYEEEERPIFERGEALLNQVDPYYDESGRAGWVSTSKWPLVDQSGKVVGLFGISRDITTQKQAEEKLQLAASVFSHSREGIMITAADATIIDVNDAFTHITGYSRDEVLGKNPRILSSGRQNQQFYADMWSSLLHKGHWYGEVWNRRRSGEVFAEMQTISAVRSEDGIAKQYVALFSDITITKLHERQLEHLAHYDALTNLPNRVLLADRLGQAMTQSTRRGNHVAVAYLDLDGFKSVNDKHGHEAGDQLLIAVAERMKNSLREGDTLARLGGDEFVAVLLDLADVASSAPTLLRVLNAASRPIHIGNHLLQVSASIGVTFYPQLDEVDADQLLRQADQAMYQAKLAGKNRYHVFDAEQDRNIRGHHEVLQSIRLGFERGEFDLHYQPKVNLRTGEVIGAEALVRWHHPQRGLLAPAAFLPLIENHSLTVDIGHWVISNALDQITRWRAAGLVIAVSVNVGARQIQQADFAEQLRTLLRAHPAVQPGDLELEILETSALEDLARVENVIEVGRELGVAFALDDFGTGYSSLTYLKRLKVAQLKIDRSFVSHMLSDSEDLAILDGVIGLASALGLSVLAEGVETVEQGEMLLQLGCELAQGFGVAAPMPAADLPGWAARWHSNPAWLGRAPVRRADLPLLFARVEHNAWVASVETCLRHADLAEPPALGWHDGRLAAWIAVQTHTGDAEVPGLADIARLHAQMHALADDVHLLQARGHTDEVVTHLGRFRALRDQMSDLLSAAILRQTTLPA